MGSEGNGNHIREINTNIKQGLAKLSQPYNWFHAYEEWINDDSLHFDAILDIEDSFNGDLAGHSTQFEDSNPECVLFFENVFMSVFFSKTLAEYQHSTVEKVCNEKNPNKKLEILDEFFSFVDKLKTDFELSPIIVILNELTHSQSILHGTKTVDLHTSFITLFEIFNQYSVESIYLQYTLWRLTLKTDVLKSLIGSIAQYVKKYFYDYDNDPDMKLQLSMDGLRIFQKLKLIEHWFELIAYHTRGIFEEYKKRDWLIPIDQLVDQFSFVDQISKYEMLRYKLLFHNDDNTVVRQKAVCNHSYGVWIKSTDVIYIFCDVARLLYDHNEKIVHKLHTSKEELLDLFDNMLKIRDYYTSLVFYHRAYYHHARTAFHIQTMQAYETDAIEIGNSIDDVIRITQGLANSNIEDLLSAKQQYLHRLSQYISDDQEQKIDEYVEQIVEGIKERIEKLDVYERIYSAVSDEFKLYAEHLLRFPQIFSTLVSAEYLYQEYIINRAPNTSFDYSCISILYYMALEDFVNKLIYSAYAVEVLDSNRRAVYADYKPYISSGTYFYDKKNHQYKRTCEIGNLGFLLSALNEENVLKEYLQRKYPNINIPGLVQYGEKLKTVAPRRNDAAHGGKLLSYEDVKIDKTKVYSANEYRGLILELINLLWPNLS